MLKGAKEKADAEHAVIEPNFQCSSPSTQFPAYSPWVPPPVNPCPALFAAEFPLQPNTNEDGRNDEQLAELGQQHQNPALGEKLRRHGFIP